MIRTGSVIRMLGRWSRSALEMSFRVFGAFLCSQRQEIKNRERVRECIRGTGTPGKIRSVSGILTIKTRTCILSGTSTVALCSGLCCSRTTALVFVLLQGCAPS